MNLEILLITWAPVISAAAAIILAIVATFTIRHSNIQYRRLREDKLLDEIINWAMDCANCCIRRNKGHVVRVEENMEPEYLHNTRIAHSYISNLTDDIDLYSILRARSVYAEYIIPRPAKTLKEYIKSVVEGLRSQLNLLHEYLSKAPAEKDILIASRKVYDGNIRIYDSSIWLSREAAKYKSG